MSTPVIQLEKVRKSFAMPGGGRVDVLDIEAFAVAPGEHLALEGQSGSGKSTLTALTTQPSTATPVISLYPDSSVVGAGIPWMVRIVPATRDEARLVFANFRTNPAGRPFRWGHWGQPNAPDVKPRVTCVMPPKPRVVLWTNPSRFHRS